MTKIRSFISLVIIIVFVTGLFYSCGKDPDAIEVYIQNEPAPLTPGQSTVFEFLSLAFTSSSAPIELVGKEVTEGAKITPAIPGAWKWDSDKLLVFRPTRDWNIEETYKIILDKSMFPKHIKLAQYTFTFTTPVFKASLASAKYYIHPENPDEKHIVVDINFSHPVDTEALEPKIKLAVSEFSKDDRWYNKKTLDFTISYNEYNTKAFIMSEKLPIPLDDVKVKVLVEKGIKADINTATSKLEMEKIITIPGMTNYIKILSCKAANIRNETHELEQVIILETKGDARIEDIFSNITVYMLPKDKPAQPGLKAMRNYNWSNIEVVDKTVLDASQFIEIEPLPGELEYVSLFSFRMNVPVNTYLYIKLNKNIPFYGGYILPKDFYAITRVPAFPKEVSILHEGAILSMSGEKKISIMSYNVGKVRFEAGRLINDQINHLITQSNGNLNNIRFQNWYFDENNLVEKSYKSISLDNSNPKTPQYFSYDFSDIMREYSQERIGIFFFKVTEISSSNQPTHLSDSRLIIITDMGILVKDNSEKSAENTHDIFVQSIATGKPIQGALVQVVGKNGIPLIIKNTDEAGHVLLPSLSSFRNEQEPVAYIVRKGKDLSFLPYRGSGRWLDFSNFDTGGIRGANNPSQLNAYIFSDRDIYRPGESMNFGIITKTGDWGKNLEGLPLEASMTDSRGLEVSQQRIRLLQDGFNEISFKTFETSPTGLYKVNLFSLKDDNRDYLIGSKTVRVEEFLPDRLRLTTGFSIQPAEGWVSADKFKAYAHLMNLYGTPAIDHTIESELTYSPAYFYFKDYKAYRFSSPLTVKNEQTETLETKKTDKEGSTEYDIDLTQFSNTTIKVTFNAKGFEKHGGRSVFSYSSIIVSPLEYIIGTKSESDLSYIYRNSEAYIDFIALNSKAKPIGVNNLTFKLKAVSWVSVLTKRPNGTYAYQSVKKTVPVTEEKKSIPKNGFRFPIPSDQAGEFELEVLNNYGDTLSKIVFSIISQENLARSIDKNAELKIQLSKSDYSQGEEIEIFIKAPYVGSGLITIEQDKVYAYKWFTSTTNSFIQHIRVPSGLEGNAYINVAFIRSIDSQHIYMSPLSYGVAPFSISREKRTVRLSLDIPKEARPGKPFPIKYKASKKSKIIVWAVNEGILQVARYTTPDPLSYFFKKRALEVKTAQILDLILPEFSIVKSLAAMGGGADFDSISKNLNPFKRKNKPPVVYWSGIVDADTNFKELSYDVPDYFNGTLHVYAIAVADDSIGVIDEKATIKDYFVLSPNVPLFASPGDKVTMSVVVANNVKGSGKQAPVKLTLSSSEHLKFESSTYSLVIDEDRDAVVDIPAIVLDILGGADINFTVSHAAYSSTLSESMSIRPPVPYKTYIQTGMMKKKSQIVDTKHSFYPRYRTKEAALSSLPLGIAHGLLSYLDHYPYGCSEQLVSSAFPYVVLSQIPEWKIEKQDAQQKAEHIISILQYRQNSDGSFGTWAASTVNVSPFLNVYIFHFLTEAKERGFYVPGNMLKKSISYIRSFIRLQSETIDDAQTKAYAIYLMTRHEVVTSSSIETLIKEFESFKLDWKNRLEGVYIASALQLMQDKNEALSLFKNYKTIEKPFDEENIFYSNYISNAQYLYLLVRHFPEQIKNIPETLFSLIVECVENRHYNTIISSYIILALTEYLKATGEITQNKFSLSEIRDKKAKVELSIPGGLFPVIPFSDKAIQLKIENMENQFLYYQVVEAGFENSIPDSKITHNVEIIKEFIDSKGSVTTKATLGEIIEVRLKFRAIKTNFLPHMVIVDLLPGGFEPILDRKIASIWKPEYMDIREDRIVCYGECSGSMSEYVYYIKAVNPGEYIVPPSFIEHMYDNDIYGITPFKGMMKIEDRTK